MKNMERTTMVAAMETSAFLLEFFIKSIVLLF
jgi:hypothetical protein